MAQLINKESYTRYYQRIRVVYQRPEIKASLEVIFSVFMVSLLIFLAIRPTLTNLATLQKKIVDEESISSKADKKIAQLFQAQEQLNTNSAFLKLYDSAVSEKFSYLEMIGRIEILANRVGVEVDSISVQGINFIGEGKGTGEWAGKIIKPDATGSMVIPVDFQISGRPPQIRNFLIEVENMDRLAVIKSVNLAKESGTTKGTEKIKAGGQINYYVYKPQK